MLKYFTGQVKNCSRRGKKNRKVCRIHPRGIMNVEVFQYGPKLSDQTSYIAITRAKTTSMHKEKQCFCCSDGTRCLWTAQCPDLCLLSKGQKSATVCLQNGYKACSWQSSMSGGPVEQPRSFSPQHHSKYQSFEVWFFSSLTLSLKLVTDR